MILKIGSAQETHFDMDTPRRELLSASLFTFGLVVFISVMVYLSITSVSDSFILGSELNGDGTVEYMCLGTHCEDLNRMDW